MAKLRAWRYFALVMALVLTLGVCAMGVTPSNAFHGHDEASVATATGTGTATIATSAGFLADVTALAEYAAGCPPPPPDGYAFPDGLFSFNITGLEQGTVIVTITLPSAVPVGTKYWKCINGQWVDCTSNLGSNDGDNVLTLTLQDGGPCDADGVFNGTIVDPGRPGSGSSGSTSSTRSRTRGIVETTTPA